MEKSIIEQVLSPFRQAVLDAAYLEKAEREKELVEKDRALLKSTKEKVRRDISDRVKHQTDAIKRDINRKLVDKKFEAKKDLLRRRMEIQTEVFSAVKDRLTAFVDSEEYLSYIQSSVKDAKVYHSSENLIAYLPKNERGERDIIEKYYDHIAFRTDENIEIGGFRLEDHNCRVILDYSLDKALKDAEDQFQDISSLGVQL